MKFSPAREKYQSGGLRTSSIGWISKTEKSYFYQDSWNRTAGPKAGFDISGKTLEKRNHIKTGLNKASNG